MREIRSFLRINENDHIFWYVTHRKGCGEVIWGWFIYYLEGMVMAVILLDNLRDFPPWFIDEVDWFSFLFDDLGGPPNLVGKRLGMPGRLGSFNDGDGWLEVLFTPLLLVCIGDWVAREKVDMCHSSSLAVFNYVVILV